MDRGDIPLAQAVACRDRADVRLHRLIERVHRLGPAPLLHLLVDVAGGADLRDTLERYAALPAGFIHANGGDRFAAPVRIVNDGEAA